VPDVLDDATLAEELRALPGWSGTPARISRSVRAPDFATGIRLVDEVAAAAEQLGHHPDIDIRWTQLTFGLATHSAGGVTSLDLALARRIDEAAQRHGAR
jgi:4a-hydroxytetrahydrobiopterin dehydratase